jgi:hypothetical protein
MNKNLYVVIATIVGIVIIILATIFNSKPVPEIRYIPYRQDTTSLKELVLTKELLRRTQDSLNAYKCDTTISAELFVAKYKLERIRYYNNIAAKGNNIRFLRGWINRVLNE